jgi:hypothetical protein
LEPGAGTFYDSQQVVDWYHAKQHLCHAAEMLLGEGNSGTQKWLNAQETRLFQDHAAEIASLIERQA